MCFIRLVVGVASDARYRNGSESRKTVPLRKGASVGMCFRKLVVGVASDTQYRNGSESRKTVPLRKGAAIGCASEGLWSGLPRMRDTTTAVNPGKWCRCGRGA